jgi:antitoxin (DNA-binding transcriptional repressor) of toxin-antitoxin stability system
MEIPITATEAVRSFSEILNAVRYKGDTYTVLRGGKAVANITPAGVSHKTRTMKDLREFISHLPSLDGDDAFKSDMEAVIKSRPPLREDDPWA